MSETVGIFTRFMRETELAILTNEGTTVEENVWIPKSQIEDLPDVLKLGEHYTFYVSVWFAEKEGLV